MIEWLKDIPPAIAIWCLATIFYATCMWVLIFKDFLGAIFGMGISSFSSR